MLPLGGARQAAAGPAAVRLGLPGVDVDHRLRRRRAAASGRTSASATAVAARRQRCGMRQRAARARQRAGVAGPERRIVVAAGLDEAQELGAASPARRRSRTARRARGSAGCSLSNAKPRRVGGAAERDRAAGDAQRLAPRRASRSARPGGRRPAERRAQPGERLAVHVLVEQREAMEVERGVVVAGARDARRCRRRAARRAARRSSARDGSATRQRSACASRAESKIASGPAIARRLRGVHEAVGAERDAGRAGSRTRRTRRGGRAPRRSG